MLSLLRFALVILAASLAAPVVAADHDWQKVGQALGKEGTAQPGGVYRVALPRSDLNATSCALHSKGRVRSRNRSVGPRAAAGEAVAAGPRVIRRNPAPQPVLRGQVWTSL